MSATQNKPIRYDYTRMMANAVGSAHGITAAELKRFMKKAAQSARAVHSLHNAGQLPFMDLPAKTRQAADIARYAERCKQYENFVVLGIGGSALGTIALQSALNPAFYNLMPAAGRGGRPRLFVEDNVDPDRIANLLEVIDPRKSLFNVISKSGSTAETMAGFMVARDAVARRVGVKNLKKHFVATTDKEQGHLRKIVDREGWDSFVVPDGVGGRFSVLTPVGLLPAAAVGIDILALLKGAAAMKRRCSGDSLESNPALLAAALQFLACTTKGKSINVMMPYSQGLRDVADWYRQLWAESLGKAANRAGQTVYAGQTPVKALGATDQHSQVQLYNEGPNDKTLTLMRVESFRNPLPIPSCHSDIGAIAYLGGRTMQELMQAECRATEKALTDHGRPNSCFIFPAVNAHTVGQIMFMLEMQTAYAGEMWDINTYDQPGVEAGKIATYALMGRPGYEKQADAIRKSEAALKPLII